jgi:hypothetical protein
MRVAVMKSYPSTSQKRPARGVPHNGQVPGSVSTAGGDVGGDVGGGITTDVAVPEVTGPVIDRPHTSQ